MSVIKSKNKKWIFNKKKSKYELNQSSRLSRLHAKCFMHKTEGDSISI